MKIGYDKELTDEAKQSFSIAETVINYSKPSTRQTDIEYFEQFLMEHKNDEIILNSLGSIGSFGFIQLHKALKIIEEKNINIMFLTTSIAGVNISENFLDLLRAIDTFDRKNIYERTIKALSLAKSEGRVGGRPRISNYKKERILFLWHDKKLTVKEIASALDISLGTVYKYLNLGKDNS